MDVTLADGTIAKFDHPYFQTLIYQLAELLAFLVYLVQTRWCEANEAQEKQVRPNMNMIDVGKSEIGHIWLSEVGQDHEGTKHIYISQEESAWLPESRSAFICGQPDPLSSCFQAIVGKEKEVKSCAHHNPDNLRHIGDPLLKHSSYTPCGERYPDAPCYSDHFHGGIFSNNTENEACPIPLPIFGSNLRRTYNGWCQSSGR